MLHAVIDLLELRRTSHTRTLPNTHNNFLELELQAIGTSLVLPLQLNQARKNVRDMAFGHLHVTQGYFGACI